MSSILVVDDEMAMRRLVTRWVEGAGHDASEAANADEALAMIGQQPPAIAVCDVRMPGHDGLWLAERIQRDFPDTAVIVASAGRDTDPRVAGHTGAVDYLAKPFGRQRLAFALERGLDWHHAAAQRRAWLAHLAREADVRRECLRMSVAELQCAPGETLDALLTLIGDDDPKLLDHSRRVAALAVRIGAALRLSRPEMETLNEAALLHDFGKLSVPHMVLQKPAPLLPGEKAIVRQHSSVAVETLMSLGGFEAPASVLLWCDRRFHGRACDTDGKRDPLRLLASVITVADAYDAMTNRQIYRDALPSAEATSELLRCTSTQFDPHVVSVLLEMLGDADRPG
ncbi:MAG TPA: response regulator [Vicinamibacterales bacterium]|nr:response regulator [Vicinamibacterales bacterium]